MWPPSSGSTGKQVEQAEGQADQTEHEEEVARTLTPRLRRDADDAHRARDLVRVAPRRQVADAAHGVGGDPPRQPQRVPARGGHRLPWAGASLDRDPDPVRAVVLLGAQWAEDDGLALALDDQLERLSLRRADVLRDVVGLRRLARDAEDLVTRLDVSGGRRAVLQHPADDVRVALGGDQEQRREEHEGEDEVDRRAGEDRDQTPPRRLTPVRVGRERPLELLPHPGRAERRPKRLQLLVRRGPVFALDRVVEPRQLGTPRSRSSVRSAAVRSPGDGRFMPGIFT